MKTSGHRGKQLVVMLAACAIAGCLAWISVLPLRLRAGHSAINKTTISPAQAAVNKLTDQLHEDPKFKMVFIMADPADSNQLIVTGEVNRKEDLEALGKRLAELWPGEALPIHVEALY